MNRRRNSSGWLAVIMIILFFTGLVFGMVVMHVIDVQETDKKLAEMQPSEEEQVVDQSVHVYYPARHIEYGQVQRNSYNPDNYSFEEGFLAYHNNDGEKISHVGVDLSYHNEKVDWDELVNNSPVEFVMLRCGYRGTTEGGLIEDEKFNEYASAANEKNIPLGVYFFSQAISEEEAISEAEFVIKLIEDFDISYPVAFDTEYVNDDESRFNKEDLSREELTKITVAFLKRIEEEGYFPMIYASENWIRRRLIIEDLADYDFWVPQYNEENDFLYDFTIWQYTESGAIPGVSGACDINISMVDYAEFVPALRKVIKSGGEVEEYDPNNPSITITPEIEGE